ncbi:MAG: hypothetical protein IT158_19635 [Bryobacterales bacterium]|nr:hypothetical protein [Bryobacterales bacterium]
MTSRERVLAAIAHREPDRVPIDHGSFRGTGIMAVAYNRLKRHLGIEGGATYLYDVVLQLAEPEDWYLRRFRVDAIDLGRAFNVPEMWHPWVLPDGSGAQAPYWFRPERRDGELLVRGSECRVIGRMPRGSYYVDQAYWPLAAEGLDYAGGLPSAMRDVTWDALPTAPWDRPLTDDRLRDIGAAAQRLCRANYAISAAIGCNLLEWCQYLFGMENTYLYIGGEKRRLGMFLDRLVERHLEFLGRLLPHLGGNVHILVVGDDLGTQRGPQMSPACYRDLFYPRHKRIYRYIRDHSPAHLMMHCCGGIYPLIPHLIDAGVEILNPVQTSARDMEPERLKREFGRDLTFWGGGCDTQTVLANSSPAEIREHVRRRMEAFMPGGGFVFTQIHNVMADVPPENVVAMLDAAYEFGGYA